MVSFLTVIHLIACLGLIGLVLIQDSKGGGVFTSQSSSSSVLGATGATSLAQTMTKVMAALLGATCITLSILSARSEKSVVDNMPAGNPPAAAATVPAGTPTTEATPATAAPAATTPAQVPAPAATPPPVNEKK
ncbi:MAG: preprotein translocase subunit SecG [Pseudobdellovibrio sp.]|jgi:preprotein translocase subunit SecG|nr:preprotein translocase subunit SecG [Pseudobdellovibrio sp.]